ncbi:hypothetical protein NPIL_355041, partial [Nephila pilipes]
LKRDFTLEVLVHANCRIYTIYFCDKLDSYDKIPPQYKLNTDKFFVMFC